MSTDVCMQGMCKDYKLKRCILLENAIRCVYKALFTRCEAISCELVMSQIPVSLVLRN